MASNLTFIVSGGRTGTKFLGDLLSKKIADCYSEHEPDLFLGFDRISIERIRRFGLWHMVFGRALGMTGVRVTGTQFMTGKKDLDKTINALRRQRLAYHSSIEQSLVLESYYAWWMVAPHLPKIFPGSKTIGVIRDPRHWIASWLARDARRSNGHWTHMLPPGPINPHTVGDSHWAKEWDTWTPVIKLAWQWMTINRQIEIAMERSNLTLLRFEDIFDPQKQALNALAIAATDFPSSDYEIGDLHSLISEKRNASDAKADSWQRWTDHERAMTNTLCGPLMSRFGYDAL
ncbi:MAG: hypothetical protein ABJP70_12775 [Erythrobacter sp.]